MLSISLFTLNSFLKFTTIYHRTYRLKSYSPLSLHMVKLNSFSVKLASFFSFVNLLLAMFLNFSWKNVTNTG